MLAAPARALLAALAELRRPATTQELAERTGRHPNTTRVQLNRLADAGLVEARLARQRRGRPRHEWAIAAGARLGGDAPRAHHDLSVWLARALGGPERGDDVERTGRRIGREIAPNPGPRPPAQAMGDALAALGFAPRTEEGAGGRVTYVLGSCPYRDAVAENQPLVCMMHRGITRGLLDRIDPGAVLAAFVAKDPRTAGCLVAIAPRAERCAEPVRSPRG